MGYLAVVFFVIAIASAAFGFGDFNLDFAGPARVLFFVSCVFFVAMLIVDKLKREKI